MPLPLYTMGQNQFDTSPLENALWKYAQHQEQQRQNAFRQQQIDNDRTRLGYEGERLGFERDRQPLELDRLRLTNAGIPLQQEMTREGILSSRQTREHNARMQPVAYDAAIEANRHTRTMNPLEEQMRRKALEDEKIKVIKDGDTLLEKTPTGWRPVEIPNAGSPGDKKFREKSGEMAAERFGGMIKHAETIPETMFNLQRLEDLSRVVGHPTARMQIAAKFGPMLKAMGMEPKNMSEIEMFSSLISRMAPNLRPPGSGATSDFDLQQYINSLPQISQTPEGRRMLIQHQKAVAQYSIAQARVAERAARGEISRAQADQMLRGLPDPHAIWKQYVNQSPAVEVQNAPAGAPNVAPPQPLDPRQVDIPLQAIQHLQQNPTPEMIRFFDEKYGPGSATRALRMQ